MTPSDGQAGLTAGVRTTMNLLELCTGATPSDRQVGLTTGVRATTNLLYCGAVLYGCDDVLMHCCVAAVLCCGFHSLPYCCLVAAV